MSSPTLSEIQQLTSQANDTGLTDEQRRSASMDLVAKLYEYASFLKDKKSKAFRAKKK